MSDHPTKAPIPRPIRRIYTTSWVFKADNGKYLHDFKVGLYGRIEDLKWTEFQAWAHRFYGRNAASVVSAKCGEPGSIKLLAPKGLRT